MNALILTGDYSAIRGTLIGALHYRCGISVRNLSQDKGEDMRRNFNCWISRELPESVAFR